MTMHYSKGRHFYS